MDKKVSLYNISSRFLDLFEKAEEGELTQEEIQEQGQALALELKNKSVSVVGYTRTLEAQENALNDEIERLTELKKRVSKRKESFKGYVKTCMENLGLQKIETAIGTISIAKNPKSVEIYDESLVDEKFKKQKVTITVDKTAIKAALENGENVQGVKLIEDKTTLRIK